MMNYDLTDISKALGKAMEAQSNSQKARTDFQNQVLLARKKMEWERIAKEQDIPIEVEKERQKKQIQTPYQQMMMDEYKKQQGGGGSMGGGGGAPGSSPGGPMEITPTATGLTPKRLGLKDMAERVYLKPQETWTPQDKMIVSRYKAMRQAFATKQGGGFADLFNENITTENKEPTNSELDDLFKGL